MKILFVWSGLTGYMGDCWRELAIQSGVVLKVVVDTGETWFGGAFKPKDVLRELDWTDRLPSGWMPDIIFTVGWHNRLCRSVAHVEEWTGVPKVCCFDMPWRWKMRCLAAKFVLHDYLAHFAAAFVPGKIAHRYADWLGFTHIYDGLFSTNLKRFGRHRGGGGFLYVGRDVPDKGTDILLAAYAQYQAKGGQCALNVVNGVSPDALGAIYAKADCFVLASRWEPWGVVLAEACGAGLPIICTTACGARYELVQEGVNGLVVKPNSIKALAEALERWMTLDGESGRRLATPYSCEAWANRVMKIAEELTK